MILGLKIYVQGQRMWVLSQKYQAYFLKMNMHLKQAEYSLKKLKRTCIHSRLIGSIMIGIIYLMAGVCLPLSILFLISKKPNSNVLLFTKQTVGFVIFQINQKQNDISLQPNNTHALSPLPTKYSSNLNNSWSHKTEAARLERQKKRLE